MLACLGWLVGRATGALAAGRVHVDLSATRVSTRAQEHQAQLDALAGAQCREIIVETASTRGDRSVWSGVIYATKSLHGALSR